MEFNVKKIAIIAGIAILAIIIINKFIIPNLKGLKTSLFGYKGTDGTKDNKVSDSTKSVLKELAAQLYEDIYCVFCWSPDIQKSLKAANALPDNEFIFMVNHYNNVLSENNLSYDVDWEALPETTEDEKIIKRMNEMGFPKTGWFEPQGTTSSENTGLNLPLILGFVGTALTAVGYAKQQGKL